jgi:hypothetical protein
MNNFLKAVSFAATFALMALSASANAQTIEVKGIGSSGMFLETGLAASNTAGTSPIGASCLWTSNSSSTSSPSNVVSATDTSVSPAAVDTGSAWVAWTPTSGSCTDITSSTKIYSYLQTDSVVGDRCLFNAHATSGDLCTIAYPVATTSAGIPTSNLIFAAGSTPAEVPLPSAVATALNSGTVNVAGTDIRPEDAWFAVNRGIANCNLALGASNSQYLGLGYGQNGNVSSFFGGSPFHVIQFTLPVNATNNAYTVTPIGATPVVVVINSPDTNGFGSGTITNITSANLALLLNGNSSWTNQAIDPSMANGEPATVLIREPLSGTYNTMEFNVPNTVAIQTSQDVGLNQTTPNCSGTAPLSNPMNIETASGAHRRRAIGTGQELSEVMDTTTNGDVLGYGFWSVANYKNFTSALAPHATYVTVDGIDPLITTSSDHTGVIPTTGSSALADVTLANVANGSYPIWSLLRLVTVTSDTTGTTNAQTLSTATQNFVSFNSTTARPDFITVPNLTVVRSHFVPTAPPIPPATTPTQPSPAANGHVGFSGRSACTATEVGGDVGGVVIPLTTDETACATTGGRGTTGERR